jgi:hypothetical protein
LLIRIPVFLSSRPSSGPITRSTPLPRWWTEATACCSSWMSLTTTRASTPARSSTAGTQSR